MHRAFACYSIWLQFIIYIHLGMLQTYCLTFIFSMPLNELVFIFLQSIYCLPLAEMTTPTTVGQIPLTQTSLATPLHSNMAMAGIPVSMAQFLPAAAQGFMPAFHSLVASGQHLGIAMPPMPSTSNGPIDKVYKLYLIV